MVADFETGIEKAVALPARTPRESKTFSLTQPLSEQMNFPGNPSFTWQVTQNEPRWLVSLDSIKEQIGHTTLWNRILEDADVTAITRWILTSADSEPVAEFVSLLGNIREVCSVRTSFENGTTHVWTYLDGKPFDSPLRYEVLEAEETILDAHSGAMLDFHLINLSEYPDEVRDDVPLIGKVIYQRHGDGEQNPASISSS